MRNFDWIKTPERRKQAQDLYELFLANPEGDKGYSYLFNLDTLTREIALEQGIISDSELSEVNLDYQDPREYPDWG